METLAIPLIALGGLYIVSNQSKNSNTNVEGFHTNPNYLPNVDVQNRNFPSELPVNNAENDLTSKLTTVNKYDTPSVYSDKYFNPNVPNSLTSSSNANTVGDAKY